MMKANKFRIYPNEGQKCLIEKHFGCSRWIYNWALKQKIDWWERNKVLEKKK